MNGLSDCGESTQRQLQNRFVGGEEKLSSIRHILITHLHMDRESRCWAHACSLLTPGHQMSLGLYRFCVQ